MAPQSWVGALVAQRTRCCSPAPVPSRLAESSAPWPPGSGPSPTQQRQGEFQGGYSSVVFPGVSLVVPVRLPPPWCPRDRCGGGGGSGTPGSFPWVLPAALRCPPALAAHLARLFFFAVAVGPLPLARVGRDPWSAAGLLVIRPLFYRSGDWHKAVQPFGVTISDPDPPPLNLHHVHGSGPEALYISRFIAKHLVSHILVQESLVVSR